MCEYPDVKLPEPLAAGAGQSQAFLLTRFLHPKAIHAQGAVGSLVTLRSEYPVEGKEGCPKQAVPLPDRRKRCKVSKVHLHTHTYKTHLQSRGWTKAGSVPSARKY